MTKHYKRATQQIELGKPISVIKESLKQHFLELDKQEFEAKLREEYDAIYPSTRPMLESEWSSDTDLLWNDLTDEDKSELIVVIDYSEDENYITFEEYKNETRIVSEAIEATYGEDGVELTPYAPEVTELTRPYIAPEVTNTEVDELLYAIGYVPKEVTEALKYLEETDWYIVRFVEAGVEVPEEVLNNRAKAREII